MRGGLFALLCLLLPAPALAASLASLFFSPAEMATIDGLARRAPAVAGDKNIRLGAVFYYGPHEWSLWLQGKMWTPQTDQPDLHVIEVQPNAVRFSLTLPDSAAREFTLKPYQTYRPVTDDVTEGVR